MGALGKKNHHVFSAVYQWLGQAPLTCKLAVHAAIVITGLRARRDV